MKKVSLYSNNHSRLPNTPEPLMLQHMHIAHLLFANRFLLALNDMPSYIHLALFFRFLFAKSLRHRTYPVRPFSVHVPQISINVSMHACKHLTVNKKRTERNDDLSALFIFINIHY